MSYTPDEAYDAPARHVQGKLSLFMDGDGEAPLEITKDNYLVSFKILEEASNNDTVFSGASANELTIQVYSPDGLFNPINSSSKYAGKMKRGIHIIPFFRIGDNEWKQVGSFYVTKWTASLAKQTASIVAHDRMYDIFDKKEEHAEMKPQQNMPVSAFWKELFRPYDMTPSVDVTIDATLPIAFTQKSTKQAITDLNCAFLTICNITHEGILYVKDTKLVQPLRATLQADVQVIEADAIVSTQNSYDAAVLDYCIPTISSDQELVDKSGIELANKVNELEYELKEKPLFRLKSVQVVNENGPVSVESIVCTNEKIKMQVVCPQIYDDPVDIRVFGQVVEDDEYTKGEEGKNTLQVKTDYVQTDKQAEKLYSLIGRYVNSDLPALKVKTRGNPNFEIGDKLRVIYPKKQIDFTGILFRQTFEYTGGLVSNLLLLDASLLEVEV